MKNTLLKGIFLGLVASAMLLSTGCSMTRINPGHIGVVVSLAGSQRGQDLPPVTTGWVTYNPFTTSVFEYPTYVQTAKWTLSKDEGHDVDESMTFKSKEGVIINADVSLSYQLTAEKIPHFYVKFRSDDLNTFTHGYLRNIARDEFNEVAGTYSVDDINGPKLGEFLATVKDRVNAQVAQEGVHIEQFGLLTAPRLPESYTQAMLAKQTAIQQAQQAENELRVAQAEAAKSVATAEGEARSRVAQAEGESKANEALARSITPNLMAWRELDIKQQAVNKWAGQVPSITGGSGSGGLNIVVPVPASR